jgi:hypothetical protein
MATSSRRPAGVDEHDRPCDDRTDHRQEPAVTRWEYATAPLISHALQQILNQWGDDGWELVAVAENVAYFKRPKSS